MTREDIIVPVDFKIYCLKAIDYALKLQSLINVKIHLLHVIESQSWWADMFNSTEFENSAARKLRGLKEEMLLPESTEIIVLQGKKQAKIIEYAAQLNARYIIMADNYPLAKGTKRLGSTLSQVVMKAEQPIITITNKSHRVFNNIAVPIDLHRSSRMQLYISLAIALNHNAKIHLVSVLFGKSELKLNLVNQKVEKYRKIYEENGIDCQVDLLVKDDSLAYKAILKYCDQKDIDTLLIMTHDEATTIDSYLGAFAQQIINDATMPVVSVNSTSAQFWEKKLKKNNEINFLLF